MKKHGVCLDGVCLDGVCLDRFVICSELAQEIAALISDEVIDIGAT